jgi:hypothetical protein
MNVLARQYKFKIRLARCLIVEPTTSTAHHNGLIPIRLVSSSSQDERSRLFNKRQFTNLCAWVAVGGTVFAFTQYKELVKRNYVLY